MHRDLDANRAEGFQSEELLFRARGCLLESLACVSGFAVQAKADVRDLADQGLP